jgi:hypothetical protein
MTTGCNAGTGFMSSEVIGPSWRAGIGSRLKSSMLGTRRLRDTSRPRKFFDDVPLRCYKRIWAMRRRIQVEIWVWSGRSVGLGCYRTRRRRGC